MLSGLGIKVQYFECGGGWGETGMIHWMDVVWESTQGSLNSSCKVMSLDHGLNCQRLFPWPLWLYVICPAGLVELDTHNIAHIFVGFSRPCHMLGKSPIAVSNEHVHEALEAAMGPFTSTVLLWHCCLHWAICKFWCATMFKGEDMSNWLLKLGSQKSYAVRKLALRKRQYILR